MKDSDNMIFFQVNKKEKAKNTKLSESSSMCDAFCPADVSILTYVYTSTLTVCSQQP